MPYSYNDFLNQAQSSGLMGEFSQEDLDLAKRYPEFGMSILGLKKDYHNATTDEGRLLANEYANQLRKSYGNYSGGPSGGSFVSQGKIPGQIDSIMDQIYGYGSFDFDQKAPVYDDQYAKQRQDLLDQILNREDFSWSKEEDPLWPVYKKQYLREGERATADTLAKVSAASGGRPSSFATTAASQAGDYYATKLNDVIPQLYDQAYQKYLNDYSMLLQDLGTVNTQEQLDYQKYLDQLGQFNNDRNFAYNKYLGDFGMLGDKLGMLQGQDQVDYARYLDQVARKDEKDRQAAEILASVGDFSGYGKLWGLTDQQTKALVDEYARQRGLSDQQAAMDLAAFYANYGDFSKLKEMGVDTGYMDTLQRYELSGLSGRRSGGGYGDDGQIIEDDGGPGDAVEAARKRADENGGKVASKEDWDLLVAAYGEDALKQNGYVYQIEQSGSVPERLQAELNRIQDSGNPSSVPRRAAQVIKSYYERGAISEETAKRLLSQYGF